MSRPTFTKLDADARKAIQRGVNAVAEPVRRTLGPAGKNVLIYRTFNRGPRITNDGVTASECISPKDPFEKLAAESFKEACKRTNEKVGDGTTTTTVIAWKLLNEVFLKLSENTTAFKTKSSTGGTNVMQIRKDILASAAKVKEAITAQAVKVETLEQLEHIATISVEDEELGKVIAKMAWEVGIDGFIDTVEGFKGEIETEVIKGMRFPAKVPAKTFVNKPERFEMVIESSPVVVTNIPLDNAAQIGEFTQHLTTSKLAIFAPSFSDNVLVNIVAAIKSGFHIMPVAVPSLRTEQLEDLAIYMDATLIDSKKGMKMEGIRERDLGYIEKVIIKDTEAREDAVATGGKGTLLSETMKDGNPVMSSAIADHIETLKGQLAETRQDTYKKMLERRIASMASAIGIIRVGGSTDAENLYKKLKIEDAVNASKAALRGGYVKGAGLTLKEIAETLPEDDLLRPALLAPYEQIMENAEGIFEIDENVIDPAEVAYYAVEHATSVVANLVTVGAIIPEMPDKDPGDASQAIADAILTFVKFDARHKGLLKDSDIEGEKDRLRLIEEMEVNDR